MRRLGVTVLVLAALGLLAYATLVPHAQHPCVEPHLLEVEMRDPAADGVLLVLLEHRRVRRLLTGQDDVEDRVQPVRAG